MKITFPHMGNMYIPIKVLLDTSGIEYVMPPFCSKGALEQGVIHSPEFACFPFKTVLGDFIYGLENGAEFILFGSGCGQCRFGYYGNLHEEILKSLDYNMQFVCLELNNMSIKDILSSIKPLTEGKKTGILLKSIIFAAKTVFSVDKLTSLARYTRCREIKRGETDRVMASFHRQAQKAYGYKSINSLIRNTRKALLNIAIDRNYKPLRISIVGEIFVGAHPLTNFDIEKKLGNMGVEVHTNLNISHWIMEHFIKKMLPFKFKDKALEAAKEFIKTNDIGGHGIYTVGHSILSAKKNFDGVVHIYPFTCMPEIIAQSTFNEIQQKYGIPIMTLIVDEMTGESGYLTRLEAFVDIIRMKKSAIGNENISSQKAIGF